MPHNGAIGTVRTSYIIDYWTICRTTETMDKAIVQAQSWQLALHTIRYVHVNRKVPRGAMSIQQYSGHIVLCQQMGAKSGLSWHDVMVLPGVRRAVEHMEDLAQLCHTGAARRYHPYCHTIRQEHSEYS